MATTEEILNLVEAVLWSAGTTEGVQTYMSSSRDLLDLSQRDSTRAEVCLALMSEPKALAKYLAFTAYVSAQAIEVLTHVNEMHTDSDDIIVKDLTIVGDGGESITLRQEMQTWVTAVFSDLKNDEVTLPSYVSGALAACYDKIEEDAAANGMDMASDPVLFLAHLVLEVSDASYLLAFLAEDGVESKVIISDLSEM